MGYQILSDPELRAKYDRDGKAGIEENVGKMDPNIFFSLLFGSERFDPWVGQLYLAMQTDHLRDAMEKEEGPDEGDSTRLKRKQLRREVKCACHLRDKLNRWVIERDQGGFNEQVSLEVVDLVSAQFG